MGAGRQSSTPGRNEEKNAAFKRYGGPYHVPESVEPSTHENTFFSPPAGRGAAAQQAELGGREETSTPGRNEEKNAAFKLYGGPYHVPESVEPSAHENTFFSPPAGGGGRARDQQAEITDAVHRRMLDTRTRSSAGS